MKTVTVAELLAERDELFAERDRLLQLIREAMAIFNDFEPAVDLKDWLQSARAAIEQAKTGAV